MQRHTKPHTAVIYVRISKDRETETSTDSQERTAREYAERKGWEVVAVEVDRGRSAFNEKDKRPAFNRSMRLIETGGADTLIVWKIDRFARGIVSFWDNWRRIEAAGGQLVSVTEDLDTTKPTGKILVGLLAGFAEMESSIKSERITAWHDGRRLRGDAPTGPRPYGYERGDDGELTIDTAEAEEIRRVTADLLGGSSFNAAVRAMTERGARTTRDLEWSRRGVRQVLTSPTTAGLRSDGQGAFVSGSWEPVLDRSTWEAVNKLLADPKRRSTASNARRWLLAGWARCELCDVPLGSKSHNDGSRYRCPSCGLGGPAVVIDEVVSDALFASLDRRAWKRLRGRRRAPGVDLDVLNDELQQLADMYASGELSMAEWRTMREGIARRVAEGNSEPAELPDVDDLQASWTEMTVEARQLVLDAVMKRVTLGPSKPCGPRFDPDRISIDWRN